MAGHRIFLSEAQLVIADPCAELQQWHLETASGKGLSVFIPLSNVPLSRGPQELLPGSHVLQERKH